MRVNEIIYIHCLEQSLTHGGYLVNAILEELPCNITAPGKWEKIWGDHREGEAYESDPVKLFMDFCNHPKAAHAWV